ncbi:hypothetical protein [Pseudolysinimonas sp.]|uniref:hypothetical protein n=1 Tax=Pseudolysinimonas sp. TaxID=2680009 RepID=UPI003F81AA3A
MAGRRAELKKILDGLAAQGATIRRKNDDSFVVYPPNGSRPLSLHTTPSDRRANLNDRAMFRRAGFHWPLDPIPDH